MLAFSAIKNNDRVGLIIFTDEVERFVPPKKGKKHVLRVISEILAFQPAARRTDLAAGLEFLARIARRRAVAFLVSDFLAAAGAYERALRITARRHDLVPVTVTDPLEEALPASACRASRIPRPARWSCSTPAARRRARFAREARARASRRASRCSGGWTWTASTCAPTSPYVPALIAFFEARARRLRH